MITQELSSALQTQKVKLLFSLDSNNDFISLVDFAYSLYFPFTYYSDYSKENENGLILQDHQIKNTPK